MRNLLRKAASWLAGPLPYFKQPSIYVAPDAYLPDHASGNALGLSAVWACTNLICGTISSLPLMVYRTARDGGRTVAYNHPLYRLLHDSPNFDQTAVDFWDGMAASVELWGNGFARVYRENGVVVALELVRPDLMTVARNAASGDIEYSWSDGGKSYKVTNTQMFHIRGFGGNPLGGLSTLSYGRHTFGLAASIERSASSTFRNGLRPAGTLTFEKFLTDEQRTVVEAKLIEKFSGAMNSGRPMILEGGTKWESLSINPEDAQMLQSRGFSVEEICRWFGVPPFMIGHSEKSTSWGTGLEQQTMAFQKFTLRRRLKRIEQACEKQLLTGQDRAQGIVIEFVLEGLLRGDSASRAAFYQSGLQNGWMTINEVRGLENLPPVTGGDVPRMQMQNVPITQAGKAPEMVAPGE